MKRLLSLTLILLLAIVGYVAWLVIGPTTGFAENVKYLYIPSDSAQKDLVLQIIERDSIVGNPTIFSLLANRLDYWKAIKPGKYKIEKGYSALKIVRVLHNGKQEPVKLVIIKFRTKEALAGAIGRKLEVDSIKIISFLNNNDSLKSFGLDSNTAMSAIFPDTYIYFWNTTAPSKVYRKFYEESKRLWTPERRQKAARHNLSPTQAYILASIIEEETNDADDKPIMASVYMNRLAKGIRLGADPTVKFAMKNFELKRIYQKYTEIESPYNTYRNAGLPPGPICTPTLETVDAVLNAPQTDYLYFVANSDFSGKHVFSSSYEEHLKYAKLYQEALNEWMKQHGEADTTK
jgi:UPF0755 protein